MSDNLLVINVISTPQGGGAELIVRELTKSLAAKDLSSHAIYFNAKRDFLPAVNESVLNVSSRSPFSVFLLRRKIKNLCRGRVRVIVHAHLTWPFFYCVMASVGLNVKLVFTEHSTSNSRRSLPLFKYFEKWFYNRYQKIICISPGVRDSLSGWVELSSSDSIVTINNGARILDLRERYNLKSSVKLISIGSLTSRKGFDVAIRAVALLPHLVTEYTIVGEGPERRGLTKLIEDLGLAHKVKLVGWSDSIEILLQEADIQIIPSLWEGFGLVAVEGMSTGLAIVASDVDGLRDVLAPEVSGATSLVSSRSPRVWANEIRGMAERLKIHAPAISAASRHQAEKFSFKYMVDSYLKLYISLFN